MDLFAGWFAVHVTHDETRSAQPHAPIKRDRLGQWRGAVRRGAAGVLHRLAYRLDPHATLMRERLRSPSELVAHPGSGADEKWR